MSKKAVQIMINKKIKVVSEIFIIRKIFLKFTP